MTKVESQNNKEPETELMVQKLKLEHVEDKKNPLAMALEFEKERQKSTQRELELTKQHHETVWNIVTDNAAKREKDTRDIHHSHFYASNAPIPRVFICAICSSTTKCQNPTECLPTWSSSCSSTRL
jgi:hypothetical protein